MPVERISASQSAAAETARQAQADRDSARAADNARVEQRTAESPNRAPRITGAIVDSQG